MDGPLPCNTLYPHSSHGYQDMTPGFTTHESSHGRKQKRTLNTPVSPCKSSDTGLRMSAILMNTPKIKFLGIRFFRIALKSQHRLAGVVLQQRQEIDLLIHEQGETWAILNEMCCFWVNTSNQVKESLTVLKKNIQILQDLKEPTGEFSEWLHSLFAGSFFWWRRTWSWLMPLLREGNSNPLQYSCLENPMDRGA